MIYYSAFLARERVSGKVVSVDQVLTTIPGDHSTLSVAQAHAEFTAGTPEGDRLRQDYSEVMLVVENSIVHRHQFPNTDQIKRQQLAHALAQAEAAQKVAAQSAAGLAAVAVRAAQAQDDHQAAQAKAESLRRELAALDQAHQALGDDSQDPLAKNPPTPDSPVSGASKAKKSVS